MPSRGQSTLHLQRFGSNRLGLFGKNDLKKDRPKIAEVRCMKYSPCVQPPKFPPTIERHDYEGTVWRNAFEEMGRLHALHMDDLKTFTILNKEPYHCASVAREFEARHGALASVGHNLTKQTGRPFHRKENTFPCISRVNLPTVRKSSRSYNDVTDLLLDKKTAEIEEAYLPPSSIRILWGLGAIGNVDIHFDRLVKKYGHVMFMIWESPRCQIVVFDNIKTCHEIVNATISPSVMNISWCDKRFNNFGHLAMFKDYKISKDVTWKKGIEAMIDKGFDVSDLYVGYAGT